MNKIFIVLLLLLSTLGFPQKRELGNVTIQELKEKVCPSDTSAAAAILFDIGEVYFDYSENDGFTINLKVRTKIKIYKKEGYEWANKYVRYYVGPNVNEKVSFSDEATYNLVNGKVEKTKLKSDGKFDEKVNKFWAQKKIALPNVREGSIIEYEYVYTSNNFGSLDKWFFQSSVPVLYCEYKTVIPQYYIYKPAFRGYMNPKITKNNSTRTINFTSKERNNGLIAKTSFTNESFNFIEEKTTYVMENLPAIKDEPYVNNMRNYISSIELELSSIQFPNQPFRNYTTDWETVAKKIYENDNFGPELNKTGYFEKDIDALLSGITSSDEKATAIFNYVKSRMTWDEFNDYSCHEGVRKAYQDKKGNVAEINLMLTAMLRYAGIEANPVLVSTRSNEISLFPSRTAFNYVICGIELRDQIILLDATNKFSLPNILPIRDLNWFGRIIRKNESSAQIDLMPTSNSKDIISIMGTINPQGELTGKIRDQYFDYNAFVFRNRYNGVTKENAIEKLEKQHQGIEITDYDVQNHDDLSKPIVENYSFISSNSVEIIGDKMYFSPFLFFAKTENPFKQESREYPVDFVYPQQDKFNISIKIPDGYAIETMPKPAAVTMPENLASFKYSITDNGGQIQLLYTQDINQAIIGAENYETLKQFYMEIVNKQTEKIVLKKV